MRTGIVYDRDYSAEVREDLTSMDLSQLEKFVIAGTLGETDETFLPQAFWEELRQSHKGRRTSPADLFAGTYNLIPNILTGFKGPGGRDWTIDTEYRKRLEQVITKIGEMCLAYEGRPTQRELKLAQTVAYVAESVMLADGQHSPTAQLTQIIQERGIVRGGEELTGILQSLVYPSVEQNPIFKIAKRLKEDTRYAALEGLERF